jgi:hypothetical protein
MDVQDVPIIQSLEEHYGRHPFPSTGFCSCISWHTSVVCPSFGQCIPNEKNTKIYLTSLNYSYKTEAEVSKDV